MLSRFFGMFFRLRQETYFVNFLPPDKNEKQNLFCFSHLSTLDGGEENEAIDVTMKAC